MSPVISRAAPSTPGGSYTTSASRDNKEWSRDIDAKLDTAIAVLKVIKKEVREPLPGKEDASGPPGAPEGDKKADLDRIKAIGRRTLEIWRGIMAALGRAEEAGIRERDMDESVSGAARDLSEKLDSAIKAMREARDELDEISGEKADK